MADVEVPTVARRKNLKAQPVFVKASIADQAGHKPGYRRQWVNRTDMRHPQHVDRYMREEFVGDGEIGYCKAEPWTVVERASAKPGRQRDDDTKGVDTSQTHGDLVLIETSDENAAIYDAYDKLRRQARARALSMGDNEQIGSGSAKAHYRARVTKGTVADDARSILEQEQG